MEKIMICESNYSYTIDRINAELEKGWTVKMITPLYAGADEDSWGKALVVLEKKDDEGYGLQ